LGSEAVLDEGCAEYWLKKEKNPSQVNDGENTSIS
jgi:hypothetical protein